MVTRRVRHAVRPRSEEGFTLVELLIVVVILGVLAGIVVYSVSGITDRGNDAACKADVQSVTSAEMAFFASQGAGGSFSTPATVKSDLVPTYLHSWPTATTITYTSSGGTYAVTGVSGSATC